MHIKSIWKTVIYSYQTINPANTKSATLTPADVNMDVDMTLESPSTIATAATPQSTSPKGPKDLPLSPVRRGITLSEFDDPNPAKKDDSSFGVGRISGRRRGNRSSSRITGQQVAAISASQMSAHQAATAATSTDTANLATTEAMDNDEVDELLAKGASEDEAEVDEAEIDNPR